MLQAHPVEASITVDGNLDEEVWQEAESVTDFLQFEPNEGAPATQRSEVRVVYGASNLYVGAVLYDADPSRIQQTLGPRDELNQADWFIVSIDSHFDQQTAFTFGVNAAGVQYDGIRTRGGGGPGGGRPDTSWDAIWESAVRVTDEGWMVEMRIPYSMLRFSQAGENTWGIHFERRIPRLGEQSEWPLVPRRDRSNLVARYGLLQGLRGIEPRPHVEVTPYTLTQLQVEEHPDQPGRAHHRGTLDLGGDLKIGISSNVTLDLTLNPDFGQVEADPAVMNLTAFETFFQERRPFFVEGVQIYQFNLGRRSDLLYTRRIGAEAPIIGAAKLSGRTTSGLSFGVLGATTGNAFSPNRHYGVARLSQQIGAYSSAGGILTAFDAPLADGRRQSVVGGVDWDFRFLDNTYDVEGYFTFSHRRATAGEGAPDTGFAGSLNASRRQGVWTYDAGLDVFDHRFDPNEMGMLRRNNYVRLSGGFGHEINAGRPFGPFQRASVRLFNYQEWSYLEALSQGLQIRLFSDWTFRTFQSLSLRVFGDNVVGGYDLFETRGLGPWAAPSEWDMSLSFETDERRNWRVEPEVGFTYFDNGGRAYEVGAETNWRVSNRLTLTGEVAAEWERDVVAWSSNESFVRGEEGWAIGTSGHPPDALVPEDYVRFDDQGLFDTVDSFGDQGPYYVPIFGSRNTRSLDLTLRSTLTFTPTLSLQFYGQLFVARGRYDDFHLLEDPQTLVPFEAFPKRDEFSFNSFQTNAVLRWEFQRGSSLYLVWSQGRSKNEQMNPLAPYGPSPYDRGVPEQITDTFSIFPNNVFLIKINYTFLH